MQDRLRKADWVVRPVAVSEATPFIERHHYAMGASRAAVHIHGLFPKNGEELSGIAWWLPSTRVACESVDPYRWKEVLSLSRMAVLPGVPKNACSFLLARAIRFIRCDNRWSWLLTYADESQGHEGWVYRACNWTYVGRTAPTTRWVDIFGRQVAQQSTKTRTKAQMLALGYTIDGQFCKHKYVYQLRPMPNADLF